jgi:hypothetical protein
MCRNAPLQYNLKTAGTLPAVHKSSSEPSELSIVDTDIGKNTGNNFFLNLPFMS